MSYAQAASRFVPVRKDTIKYERKVSLKVRPTRDFTFRSDTQVAEAFARLGFEERNLTSLYYYASGGYEVEFPSEAAKRDFMKVMDGEAGRRMFQYREFEREYQQVTVTRVPVGYPDANIRNALEVLGEIKIQGEGVKEERKSASGKHRWYTGRRAYFVKTEDFWRMKELPQLLVLGHEIKFFVSYRGMVLRCLNCDEKGHLARDCKREYRDRGRGGPTAESTGEGEQETTGQQREQREEQEEEEDRVREEEERKSKEEEEARTRKEVEETVRKAREKDDQAREAKRKEEEARKKAEEESRRRDEVMRKRTEKRVKNYRRKQEKRRQKEGRAFDTPNRFAPLRDSEEGTSTEEEEGEVVETGNREQKTGEDNEKGGVTNTDNTDIHEEEMIGGESIQDRIAREHPHALENYHRKKYEKLIRERPDVYDTAGQMRKLIQTMKTGTREEIINFTTNTCIQDPSTPLHLYNTHHRQIPIQTPTHGKDPPTPTPHPPPTPTPQHAPPHTNHNTPTTDNQHQTTPTNHQPPPTTHTPPTPNHNPPPPIPQNDPQHTNQSTPTPDNQHLTPPTKHQPPTPQPQNKDPTQQHPQEHTETQTDPDKITTSNIPPDPPETTLIKLKIQKTPTLQGHRVTTPPPHTDHPQNNTITQTQETRKTDERPKNTQTMKNYKHTPHTQHDPGQPTKTPKNSTNKEKQDTHTMETSQRETTTETMENQTPATHTPAPVPQNATDTQQTIIPHTLQIVTFQQERKNSKDERNKKIAAGKRTREGERTPESVKAQKKVKRSGRVVSKELNFGAETRQLKPQQRRSASVGKKTRNPKETTKCGRCKFRTRIKITKDLKEYTCPKCNLTELKCNSLNCPNWHLVPEGEQRVTCKCNYTKFYCACDVFHAAPSHDTSYQCKECMEFMDPPVSSPNDSLEYASCPETPKHNNNGN